MKRAWLLLALVLLSAPGTSAYAADYAVRPPAPSVTAVDALCANPAMLKRIAERFAWAERNTWRRGFEMAAVLNPRLRYPELDGPSLIARVRCMADAVMTNNTQRTVYYIVEAEMGFASVGKGVDFCVLGLDPWRVYDRACRTMR